MVGAYNCNFARLTRKRCDVALREGMLQMRLTQHRRVAHLVVLCLLPFTATARGEGGITRCARGGGADVMGGRLN